MVDRASACIIIGGHLPPDHLPEFLALIADEDLSLAWDGEPFALSQLVPGEPLRLMAHDVALGQFSQLEDFCVARGLPFRRWCDGSAAWLPQRAVFDGKGDVAYLKADGADRVLLDRDIAIGLGSFGAVVGWFEVADMQVPPLVIGDASSAGSSQPHALVKVRRLVPLAELEEEDRNVLPLYAVDLIEAARDIFHHAVAIGTLDRFAIEVAIVTSGEAVPVDAVWLTQADSLLLTLPALREVDHG